jgi:oligoendopeptidase F
MAVRPGVVRRDFNTIAHEMGHVFGTQLVHNKTQVLMLRDYRTLAHFPRLSLGLW